MESIWRKEIPYIEAKQHAAYNNHWDVIVIGAGLSGLLTAYYLKKKGKNVLVLEADRIASGQTERTTAKMTSQHDIKYSKLIKTIGLKKAEMYAKANEAAINEYERLINEQGIECDFKRVPAYLYTLEDEKKLEEETKAALRLGTDAYLTKETELPFPVKCAMCFPEQAQFSPLKFLKHISSELDILEHTKVNKIKGNKVITDDKVFTAEKIVMAAHYPFRNFPGFYFLRQHQERSFVLALSGCTPIKGMYYGIDKNGLSFRQSGDVLLLGGGKRRTGKNEKGGAFAMLRSAAAEYYPQSKEISCWAAQDCMPHDGIPFIGRFSIFTPNLYVITGFQKWGITTSMVAAMIISDAVCGVKNPYSKVFRPQRCNVAAGIGKLLVDLGESIKGLSKGWFNKKTKRCAHLGCELVWNEDEKSWDCPCHGSRYDSDGKILDNPTVKEIK